MDAATDTTYDISSFLSEVARVGKLDTAREQELSSKLESAFVFNLTSRLLENLSVEAESQLANEHFSDYSDLITFLVKVTPPVDFKNAVSASSEEVLSKFLEKIQ